MLDLNDKVRRNEDVRIQNRRTRVVTQTVESDWCGHRHHGLSIARLIGSELNPRVLMMLSAQQRKILFGNLDILLFK